MRLRWAPVLLALVWSDVRAETIHYLAEHLPEAAQDARYIALPWPAGPFEPGRWSFTVQMGWTRASAGPLDIDGPMLGIGLRRVWSGRSGVLALAFADPMTVSGQSGTEVLDLRFAPTSLGLPQQAEFSHPRGTYRHWGVGAAWTHGLLGMGLLFDHLSVDGYAMDYRLLAGPAAGTVGVLDHSSAASYVTPFAQLTRTWDLGSRLALTPRFSALFPLPAGAFDARLTGPGFDVAGVPAEIGDPVLGGGMGLLYLRTGLEVDLGVALVYPLVEHVSHPGVDRAWTLQLAWHSSRPRKQK